MWHRKEVKHKEEISVDTVCYLFAQLGVRMSISSLWSGPSLNSSISSSPSLDSVREVKQGRFLRILINLA